MDDMTLLSTEAEGVNDTIPEEHRATHVNSAGRVGALLGLTDTAGPGANMNGELNGGTNFSIPDKVGPPSFYCGILPAMLQPMMCCVQRPCQAHKWPQSYMAAAAKIVLFTGTAAI